AHGQLPGHDQPGPFGDGGGEVLGRAAPHADPVAAGGAVDPVAVGVLGAVVDDQGDAGYGLAGLGVAQLGVGAGVAFGDDAGHCSGSFRDGSSAPVASDRNCLRGVGAGSAYRVSAVPGQG